jgi:hypothetical protein
MIQQNSYPMKEWHRENMQKRVIKYVIGLPDNATSYQKKQHKKYGANIASTILSMCRTHLINFQFYITIIFRLDC